MSVLSIVLPVFLVLLLGAILTRVRFLKGELIAELNRLTYFVGLPAYLFTSIAEASYGGGRAITLFGVMCAATLLVLLIGVVIVRVRGISPDSAGSFLHASIRGNLAYIGLPVVSLAIAAHAGSDAGTLRQTALLAMAPLVVLTNTLGVLLLLVGHQKPGPEMARQISWQLATNPLLLASLAGVLCASFQVPISPWLMTSVTVVGQMALPLALLCIGGTLVIMPIRGKRTNATLASLLKVALTPLLGWPIARWTGLNVNETRVVLLFLASPTAAASFTLAGKLGGDEALAATSVVVSTAASVATLTAVLLLV